MLKILYNFFLSSFIILIISINITGCNNNKKYVSQILEASGSNRVELEKVIDHYKETGDKEKLKAAYFLIGNMENKYGRYGELPKQYFSVFKTLHELHDNKTDLDSINKIIKREWDSIERIKGLITYENFKPYPDYNVISADYLIENIDYAFKAWKEKPWAKHLNFDQFCEFILPYRVYDEPLQFFRKNFANEFIWLKDSLKDSTDPLEACLVLNKYLAKRFVFCSKLDKCPILGINDMMKYNGGICEHRYYIITMVMRSVGIPVAIDFTPQWNEHPGSHSWLATIDKNGKHRFFNGGEPDVSFPDTLKVPVGLGAATKVYRRTFKINNGRLLEKYDKQYVVPSLNDIDFFDVTGEYDFPQNKLPMRLAENPQEEVPLVYLSCFGNSYQLVPVAWVKYSKDEVTFDRVGSDCIYVPTYFNGNNLQIANNPYYVNTQGTEQIFNPDVTHTINMKITRKSLPQQYLYSMFDFTKWMVGAEFQASNDKNFSNYKTLHIIDSSYFHFAEKTLDNNERFRYYRYKSSSKGSIRIAELEFVTDDTKDVISKSSWSSVFGYIPEDSISKYRNAAFRNAFDGNVASNLNAPVGSWVAIDYGKPVVVNKLRFLVRNDLNVIEIGDEYELFYFDMGWKSLGKKVATTNYLLYDNAPSNALFLIRDNTKGKEERIFIYKNGRQVWI